MITTKKLDFKLEEEDIISLQHTYELLSEILNEIENTEDPFTQITLTNENTIIDTIKICKKLDDYI